MSHFKRYLIAGLLLWVPIAITAWVIVSLIGFLDQTLLLLPEAWRPKLWLGFDIPGLGAILALVVLLATGILGTNLFGQKLISWWNKLLGRIPVVKSIYSSVKQVSDTLLSDSGNAFRQALLIQYPHQDCWTVAFLTGSPADEIAALLAEPFVSVYIPTTPNPTSGFFLMLPAAKVKPLNMSVDAALKYIISMGVVSPVNKTINDKIDVPEV